jgi:hypothetical protein
MDYINYKIKGLQDEIDSKLEYIEKLKLIENDRQLIFKLRNEILHWFTLNKKTRMGKLKEYEITFNNELKHKTNCKLINYDTYFNITKDEAKQYYQEYRFELTPQNIM